jgi:hypothetical protein
MTTEWVRPLQKPVVIALCFSLAATPFIINANNYAQGVTPPTEWRGRVLDAGFMDAFAWLRENSPENSIVAIEWSYGHLLTGTARRAAVSDGTETLAELGKWENTAFPSPPPDYIYTVSDSTGNFLNSHWTINGRRTDVQYLPTLTSDDELEFYLKTYRDNYGVQIDYMVLNQFQYNDAIWATRRGGVQDNLSAQTQGQEIIYTFRDENVAFNLQQWWDPQVRRNGANLTMAGVVLYDLRNDQIITYYFGPSPEVPRVLWILLADWNPAWAQLTAPTVYGVPMVIRVFEGRQATPDYANVVYTSNNGVVKVLKIHHVPSLTSPADGVVINDNTPTLTCSGAVGAVTYEFWVDNNSDFQSPEILENISGKTYTSTSALVDGTYYWRVRALGADNRELGLTSTWTFTIDTVQPAAPTLVSPEYNRTDNVMTKMFTWSRPESDATYHLQISTTAAFEWPYFHDNSSIAENSYSFTLTAGGTYYWRVRARDAAGNWSAWSENFRFTFTAPPGAPGPYLPENGARLSDNTPELEWSAGFFADNHRLLVDNDSDFSSPEVDILFGFSEIWTPGPLADDNYYWKVIGINAWGENSSPVWAFTVDTTPPSTPALVSPTNGLHVENTPVFDWSDVADAKSYEILVDNDADFSSPEIPVSDVSLSTYTPTITLGNGTYSWKVRAYDNAGNAGSFSSTWTFIVENVAG